MDRSSILTLLDVMPSEWRGTTFDNSNLLGRERFALRLRELLSSGAPITAAALEELGNAEDYARVASNVSTMLEAYLAHARDGYEVGTVFTFASRALPVVAVLLTCNAPRALLYHGDEPPPFTMDELQLLAILGTHLELKAGAPPPLNLRSDDLREVVLGLEAALPPVVRTRRGTKRRRTAAGARGDDGAVVHAVIASNVLYICDSSVIEPAQVALVRKRCATPATTPMAEAALRKMAEPLQLRAPTKLVEPMDGDEVSELLAHLQQLSGRDVDLSAPPHLFTAGLPALASLWLTLLREGGAEILMSATAYGGSSQLTDLLAERTAARATDGRMLRKHTFDVAGATDLVGSVAAALAALGSRHAASGRALLPTTVVFIELPTNPDMKVPCLVTLVRVALAPFIALHGTASRVLLLLDTTLAPCSAALRPLRACAPDLDALAFISLSKSVSRGLTTAGALVPNHTPRARALMRATAATARTLCVSATADQLATLTQHHRGVEERCRDAYGVAATVGRALCDAVGAMSGREMRLSFVSAEQAAAGFESSTFSFNLPPPAHASDEVRAGMAQRFVTHLTSSAPSLFKPCVSFGQDNGKVYCTVPATSTQGAIKPTDKAKQAIGGVQLVRLSFPPAIDTHAVCRAVADAVAALYAT